MACCGPICRLADPGLLFEGLPRRGGQNELAGGHDLNVLGAPAGPERACHDVAAEFQRVLELRVRGKDDVGLPGGEVPALGRVPGLEQYRPVLGAARQPRGNVHG